VRTLYAMVAGVTALLAAPAALAADKEGFQPFTHLSYLVDFIILAGVLGYALRGPLATYLSDRHDAIRKEMDEATARKADATERLARYERHLRELDAEVATMRSDFERDGLAESERILADAQETIERLRADAILDASREATQMKLDLEREVAERALIRAEALVRERMNAARQRTLVERFITDLESRKDLGSLSA
jgi:F-type H+-transporting ATPase subunit b